MGWSAIHGEGPSIDPCIFKVRCLKFANIYHRGLKWSKALKFCSKSLFFMVKDWRLYKRVLMQACSSSYKSSFSSQPSPLVAWKRVSLLSLFNYTEQYAKTIGTWYNSCYKLHIKLTPGAPLTNFNDGGGGGGGGGGEVQQRFIFYAQKNHNFRICLPKKITTFLSIPKKIC